MTIREAISWFESHGECKDKKQGFAYMIAIDALRKMDMCCIDTAYDSNGARTFLCPSCGAEICRYGEADYCPFCGQCIDW